VIILNKYTINFIKHYKSEISWLCMRSKMENIYKLLFEFGPTVGNKFKVINIIFTEIL